MPLRPAIERLHTSTWQGVFYIAGGGATLISELLAVAGASRSVLEASVPYSEQSLAELLGGVPDQAASIVTARSMAMRAFQRSVHLGAREPFGFACTASLATNRSKRGAHRAHLAIQTEHDTYSADLALSGSREQEERTLTAFCVDFLQHALDLAPVSVSEVTRAPAEPDWRELVRGVTRAVASRAHPAALIFPGSFNPLHEGHRQMMLIGERRSRQEGAFEISIENPDKPMLDYHAIRERVKQFDRPVWLTRLPTFLDKARQFPDAAFIVGSDTLIRITDARYYDSAPARDRAIDEMIDLGTAFLVFGRAREGVFEPLHSLQLPQKLLELCTEVPEADFRLDITSREIRTRR